MTMNDYRLSHIYRTPIYQKRIINPENYVSSSLFILSSSPNRTAFVTRRHYSTPVISTLRFIEVKSPTSNKVIKLYYPHVGLAHLIRDQSSISDSAKSMSLSTSLVKRRYQEERIAYMARTPTSICSDADIILPVAKKNRNTIIETSCPIVSDVQSSSQDITTRKLWKERERAMSFDFEDDIPISNKDSLQDGTYEQKSIQCMKWHDKKCGCRFASCNCCHWYYRCPYIFWILSFVLILGLIVLVSISVKFLSD